MINDSLWIFQSLIDWDYREPSSLFQVIEELLQQYRLHQEKLVCASQRLQFEYKSLVEESGIESEAVEIHVSRSEVSRGQKYFNIALVLQDE